MTKFAKLMMVAVNVGSAAQSNKFYEMEWDGKSPNFNVKYGRVESTEQTASYPIYQWDKKYNEKVNKGYKDVTHTVMVEVVKDDKNTKLEKIQDTSVDSFLTLMKKYTDGLVSKTYTVKAQNVTQAQVNNAQALIDQLMKVKKADKKVVNPLLLQLYMEIPRYMGNVNDYLLPALDLTKALQQEQDNLDAMAAQVSIIKTADKKQAKKVGKTLLDVLGITMKQIKPTKDLDYLVKQLSSSKIRGVFEIQKSDHDQVFDTWMGKQKNKQTRILIHGTRCTSVIPIIEQGLKIRPTGNYQFSGKAYGDGNYFSEVCSKSLSYTGQTQAW